MKITENILELIGNTPLIRLRKIAGGAGADILAKCEYMNPSGSIKDRMALHIIEAAEEKGVLKPNSIIVDSTTGNTGIALSLVGGAKGYKVKLMMPKVTEPGYATAERIKIIKTFGGEVMETPSDLLAVFKLKGGAGGIWELGGRKKCYEMEKSDPNVFWARQMSNPSNIAAHREGTGREILEQSDGKVDAWVASIGTGGTLLGVAEALRQAKPDVEVIGVEPENTPLIDWIRNGEIRRFLLSKNLPEDVIDNMVEGIIQTALKKGILNEVISVNDYDARSMANKLAREEGLFVGMSSGANVHAALQVAKRLGKGKNVVTVLVDRRDRYLSEFPEEHYVT